MSQEQQEPTPDVVEPATENIEAVEATDDASAEVEVDLTEETPDGYEAHYTRIGNQDISGLRFERDSLGVMRLTLDKQSSDSDVLNLIRQLVTK